MTTEPYLPLSAVYGPDVIYNGRASWKGYDYLRRGDLAVRDAFTGTLLTITGSTPLVCSAGAFTPGTLRLFEAAELPFTNDPLIYANAEQYQDILAAAADNGRTIAFQHRHPPDEVPARSYWISPDLLSWLNDKANLCQLVPLEFHPPRRVMSLEAAISLPLPRNQPLVVKGSTNRSTGSGGAVVIARTDDQLKSATQQLAGCTQVVVEEFQPFERTICVTWAADRFGSIHYVGSADQIVDPDGTFQGSWIGPRLTAPEAAIALGREIMGRAVERGYLGFAGFDMGLLPDGRVLAFDLNFRLCTSTPALLWLRRIQEHCGLDGIGRLGTFRGSSSFEALCRTGLDLVRQGVFMPLGAFDPAAAGWPGRHPSIRGMILGRDRAETEARCETLAPGGVLIG